MTKQEKLVKKLSRQNASLTWDELQGLLIQLGYKKLEGSGSRVKFDNGNPHDMIFMHKPHPQKEVKKYMLKQVTQLLKDRGLI